MIQLGFEIPFDQIEAAQVEPAIDTLLASSQAAVDAIVTSEAPRTYANTLGALEEATEMLERAMTVVGHLESVATTEALRDRLQRDAAEGERVLVGARDE